MELVPGDVMKLTLGGVVAADVKITGGEVQLDQSMLTGESVPIEAGTGIATFAGALVRRAGVRPPSDFFGLCLRGLCPDGSPPISNQARAGAISANAREDVSLELR